MTLTEPRACAWCRGAIAPTARRDALTCSKRCRQARHRFVTDVGTASTRDSSAPLRLAYADPPYPGLSRRYYGDHPDFAGEVDHAELVSRLQQYDGWALSTSAASLQAVLALCPPGVRVASWHRGERPTASRWPLNAWEPVIFHGGRPDQLSRPAAAERDASPGRRDASLAATEDASRRTSSDRAHVAEDLRDVSAVATAVGHDASRRDRRLDTLEHFSRPRLADPHRVVGSKPAVFCRWMFELLGAEPQDHFTDLFPGSGGVDRAWATYTRHNHPGEPS